MKPIKYYVKKGAITEEEIGNAYEKLALFLDNIPGIEKRVKTIMARQLLSEAINYKSKLLMKEPNEDVAGTLDDSLELARKLFPDQN